MVHSVRKSKRKLSRTHKALIGAGLGTAGIASAYLYNRNKKKGKGGGGDGKLTHPEPKLRGPKVRPRSKVRTLLFRSRSPEPTQEELAKSILAAKDVKVARMKTL